MATSESLPALPCPIAPYVPQRQDMCLLDRILAVDDVSLRADVMPGADDLFATEVGIPGWTGLEWLAQAVAAWAGWHAAAQGEAPAIGFLIGTKRFETTREHLPPDRTYQVTIRLDFRADNGLGHFRGEILDDEGRCLAAGTLAVFQPPPNEETQP
ncbi:Predicted 3-hydroxylacyl-ACP dehydratase, HotDog domain [Modicisalibacter ilicicola DSM 19980]|uniref:Predicted 3-hydroxylacyl-ACP dehydratase, HotDog domain n=1 Tax=Modicisalibacter ilicicola DSM 19980 TaxID=1121942 RepID=A0A1M4ZV18_9GAMM|nr:hypothetical protein [Halomonas ilicicola]SHF21582.1 Predicted 3-hydroxylacyl-ACP dehydratase, HotDog domain [Halomonas ilicicola DSM 19980]